MRKTYYMHLILSVVAFFMTALFFCFCEAAEPVLIAKIEMVNSTFKAKDSIRIKYTLNNVSEKAVHVLKWNTPLEGFYNNIFKIMKGGKRILYIGPMIKRAKAGPDDYVTLKPGGSVSAVLDIAEAYAIYEAGEYSVHLAYGILDVKWENGKKLEKNEVFTPAEVQSSGVTFSLLEDRQSFAPREQEYNAQAIPVFKNCSNDQMQTLNGALSSAKWLSMVAETSIRVTPMDICPGARRCATWFGTYTADRYKKVWDDFIKIRDAVENKTMTFNCDCTKNVYAYVFPNVPYEIYLCKAFWPAPMTGTDSKAGTIIHETSHFYAVAGTQDYAYGQINCQNLANNDPGKAIDNADSHEYFAEDTPPIPMP
ncbi:MAG: hypothetical protein EPN94_07670 [Nitrospirae bacterium]|nr:MAG: hypothetical protein EPN94_07670 [Nitrospirota bacterium]